MQESISPNPENSDPGTIPSGNSIRVILLDKSEPDAQKTAETLKSIRPCEIGTFNSVHTALQDINTIIPDVIITELELEDHSAEELLRVLF